MPFSDWVVPKRPAELRSHFLDLGVTADVVDLQPPYVVSDQVHGRVDVDAVGRRVDVPRVVAGKTTMQPCFHCFPTI